MNDWSDYLRLEDEYLRLVAPPEHQPVRPGTHAVVDDEEIDVSAILPTETEDHNG